ncbi:MAG: c-type cytochrome [Fimbriimonadales bacterium]|jgi:mono/diheme cytochrome c family protein
MAWKAQLSVDRPTRPSLILRRAAWMLLGILSAGLGAITAAMGADEPSLIERGQYISHLADCVACHTRTGGTPFAGGLPIRTPFGTVTSTNITPDLDTGIGGWSDEDFYRAVSDGIGRHGEYLYPAMSFTSFTKMTRSDVLAIKVYLFSLKPVHAPRVPNNMAFPFDMRWTLFAWRALFFHAGVYQPDPKRSAEWNRGAYLVEGAGHCGECHSPRNILEGTETQNSLAGGKFGKWLAPNISADPRWGIGDKSVNDLVTFLKTGSQKTEGVAFGPMAEVVHDSLHYVSTADLQAIAVFLKAGPERAPSVPDQVASRGELQHGQKLYLDNCAKCHQDKGQGSPGIVPNLADNAAITSAQPDDLIDAVLSGLHGSSPGTMPMPSFARALSDQDVADIANYVRSDWGNHAPTNATPALVASLRGKAAIGQK